MQNWKIALVSLLIPFEQSIAASLAGGISGGGGDIQPSEGVSIEEVSSLVPTARMQLILFVNFLSLYPKELPSHYRDLFGRQNDLPRMIRRIAITENNQEPCRDQDSKPVDGSTLIASGGKGVCISTYNLSKKLNQNNASVQLVALLAHEYSHLAGADEVQARLIQQDVMRNLAGWSASSAMQFAESLLMPIFKAKLAADELKTADPSQGWEQLCRTAERLNHDVEPVFYSTAREQLSLFDLQTQVAVDTVRWQFANLAIGACILAKRPLDAPSEWTALEKAYGLVYQHGDVVSVQDFVKLIAPQLSRNTFLGGFSIPKITAQQVLASEAGRAIELLNFIENTYWAPLHGALSNYGNTEVRP